MLVVGISLIGMAAGKVAIVLDVGGRGDLSFNDMGFKGTDQAAEEFGLTMVEVQSATANDYLPNLRNLARTGEYDLIIAVGFLLGDALATASAEYPDQKFAIIDVDYITGPNIANYVFKENEMSALIGALNAMVALQEGFGAAGVVLGIPIPVLYHFEAGYRYGMDWGIEKYGEATGVTEGVTMLYNYTGTFSDIALGKAASEAMLAQGAVGIYNVAGPLGVGDLEAVTEYHDNFGTASGAPYYFGVDANQDWMGMAQHTLASGMKRVDLATYLAVKSVVEGTFTAGVTVLDMANGGVAISKAADLNDFIDFGIKGGAITEADRATIVANWNANRAGIPQFIWDAIDELEAGIIDGSIVVPTANTDDEINALRAEYPLE
jgi:basic membrane protein A